MKIDLCKIFGVEEGEEFKLGVEGNRLYRCCNNELEYFSPFKEKWVAATKPFNLVIHSEVIKLPKRKEFTDDELRILRNIDKEYKWIARDSDGKLFTYNKMPIKSENINKWKDAPWLDFCMYDHLFQSVKWEDEEPVCIDDYVKR